MNTYCMRMEAKNAYVIREWVEPAILRMFHILSQKDISDFFVPSFKVVNSLTESLKVVQVIYMYIMYLRHYLEVTNVCTVTVHKMPIITLHVHVFVAGLCVWSLQYVCELKHLFKLLSAQYSASVLFIVNCLPAMCTCLSIKLYRQNNSCLSFSKTGPSNLRIFVVQRSSTFIVYNS